MIDREKYTFFCEGTIQGPLRKIERGGEKERERDRRRERGREII